jgi:hypothetical protein
MGCPHDYRITSGGEMEWGVINSWGVLIAQFDKWDDAQMFRSTKGRLT